MRCKHGTRIPPCLAAQGARIACVVWFPFIFTLADRVAKSPGGVPIAQLGLVLALQLTAGYPAFTLSLAVLLSIHAVVSYATGAWQVPPWKTIPRN